MSNIEFQIGASAIRNYKRLSYEIWYALAEFIDNSTQSYFNNREDLDKVYEKEREGLEVVISYDQMGKSISIRDNAMGMNLDELRGALRLGTPPKNPNGRSEFGMGLKTAACWLGDIWTVKTKKLGSKFEYEIEFDVEKIASGQTELIVVEREKPENQHHTVVEIKKMHRQIAGRSLSATKNFLRSIYRIDTREGILTLKWGQDEVLNYDTNISFLKAKNGEDFRREFDFTVNGKRVQGWGGILEVGTGNAGRPRAGFATVRRKRVIQGQPSAWRPRAIFGQEDGTNNLVNQRIVGEVHLDQFMASHTKDAISWMDDEEEQVGEMLKKTFADFIHIAQEQRKENVLPEAMVSAGVQQVKSDMEKPEFIDAVTLNEVPTPEMVKAENQPIIDATRESFPDQIIKIGDFTLNIFHDTSYSPNEPYYVCDYGPNSQEVNVAINTKHPFFQEHVTDTETVKLYVLLCCLDALAEWKCLLKTAQVEPKTVNSIKNDLMYHQSSFSLRDALE